MFVYLLFVCCLFVRLFEVKKKTGEICTLSSLNLPNAGVTSFGHVTLGDEEAQTVDLYSCHTEVRPQVVCTQRLQQDSVHLVLAEDLAILVHVQFGQELLNIVDLHLLHQLFDFVFRHLIQVVQRLGALVFVG